MRLPYWVRVRIRAKELNSDGCTLVTEAFQECCFEHDVFWRTKRMLNGKPITKCEANVRFRRCMQRRSRFGKYSPMAWWRWAGVSIAARFRK